MSCQAYRNEFDSFFTNRSNYTNIVHLSSAPNSLHVSIAITLPGDLYIILKIFKIPKTFIEGYPKQKNTPEPSSSGAFLFSLVQGLHGGDKRMANAIPHHSVP